MLSEVPEGWVIEAFDKIARLQSGFAFKSKQFVDDPKLGLPIIRIRDLNSQSPSKYYAGEVSEEYKVNAGDILVGMDGQFDCVEWQGEQAALNQRVLRVYPTENSEKKFLHYMLAPILKVLEGQITGTTVKHLSTRNLKSLNLPLPPLTEQKRIADVLSSVDESIQATQRLIEQAERVKQGLMEELLTGGLGSEAIERGEVPEGWQSKTLAEICEIARGGSPRPIDSYITDEPDGINWIKIGDASASSKYIYKTKQKIRKEGVAKSRTVQAGDFLLSNSMSFGKPYILRLDGCIHDGWLSLTMNQQLIIEEYLYYLLSSRVVKTQFLSKASGSAVKNLNKQLVGAVKVAIPSLMKQKETSEFLSKLDEQVELYKVNLTRLESTKKGLMDDLLTGKVRTV